MRLAIIGTVQGYSPKSHISSLIRHRIPEGVTIHTSRDWDGCDNVVRAVAKMPGPDAIVHDKAGEALDASQIAVYFWVPPDEEDTKAVITRYPDLCCYWLVQAESYKWWSPAVKSVLRQYMTYGLPERRLLNA